MRHPISFFSSNRTFFDRGLRQQSRWGSVLILSLLLFLFSPFRGLGGLLEGPLGDLHHGLTLDGETGETLPYVRIQASSGKATLSNLDGSFSIDVQEDDTLHFHCVGFKTLHVPVRKLPERVRLHPNPRLMNEVKVLGIETILDHVDRELKRSRKAGKEKRGQFFCRIVEELNGREDLIEGFLDGRDAIHLQDITIMGGRRRQINNAESTKATHQDMNMHHILELGPAMAYGTFWERVIQLPFNNKNYDRYYDWSYIMQEGEDGHMLYRITLHKIPRTPGKNIVTGRLYVDTKDFHLLRFEGHVPNISIMTSDEEEGRRISQVDIDININYRYDNGFCEVQDLNYEMKGPHAYGKGVLFGLDKPVMPPPDKKRQRVRENMIASIDEAGFDSVMWSRSGVIERTKQEERIAFGRVTETEAVRQSVFVPDTAQVSNPAHRRLLRQLDGFAKTRPQEKVYIHTDNQSYLLGDTIWYAAYTRNTTKDEPSSVSNILYVELLNQDGFLVERQLIEMRGGRGHGAFVLDHQVQYAGFYELRAYTRWQLNWGRRQHPHPAITKEWFLSPELEERYYRDYDKLYSRVFPVYDTPKDSLCLSRNMTPRPLRRYFKEEPDNHERTLTLFPEGGHLIAGIPCRVAFEAMWNDGEWMEGALVSGHDTIPVTSRGRGVFTVTPKTGEAASVLFIDKNGNKVKARLPKAETQGASLSVTHTDSLWHIHIATAGLDPAGLALSVMHEGTVELFRTLDGSTADMVLSEANLRSSGVHQVTLFDADGRIWSDRLFFAVKSEEMSPTLAISGLKASYDPYERIDLKVQAKAPILSSQKHHISLSIHEATDEERTFDNANILQEMLLSSEIKGFVPNPGWFFEKDDKAHREALDLMMMTQGWRRFDWQQMTAAELPPIYELPEKQQILKGTVYKGDWASSDLRIVADFSAGSASSHLSHSDMEASIKLVPDYWTLDATKTERDLRQKDFSEKPRQRLSVHAKLANHLGQSLMSLPVQVTDKGIFHWQLPRINEGCMLFLGAQVMKDKQPDAYRWYAKKDPEEIKPKEARRIFNESYDLKVCIDFPYPRFVKPYDFYQEHLGAPTVANDMLADGTHLLREVSIGAKHNGLKAHDDAHPAFVLDDMEAENIVADAGMYFADFRLARPLFSTFGSEYPYAHNTEGEAMANIKRRFGINLERRTMQGLDQVPADSVYAPKYLRSYPDSYPFSPGELKQYAGYGVIEKWVIYTDYSPRLAGSPRYAGANIPNTSIAAYPYPDERRHLVTAGRQLYLPGINRCGDCYCPDYSRHTLPDGEHDYRRTLYWNPSLQLDANGQASVTCYGNSRPTRLSVDAEGQAGDGTLLWGK